MLQLTRTPVNPTTTDVEFIHCSCGGESISLAVDGSAPYDIHLAFWLQGFATKKLGWLKRLQFCWYVIRTGCPWTDFVCLPQKDVRRLVSALLKRQQV